VDRPFGEYSQGITGKGEREWKEEKRTRESFEITAPYDSGTAPQKKEDRKKEVIQI